MAASFSFRAPIESTKDQKPRFDPGFENLGSTPVLASSSRFLWFQQKPVGCANPGLQRPLAGEKVARPLKGKNICSERKARFCWRR